MTSAKVRVLVIDDEENIRRTLRLCLDTAGYQVSVAPSGEAGLTAARRAPPDVVLVDLRLGGMDGIAVTKQLLQDVPNASVLVMTAYASIDAAVEALRAGAVDFLPKPFTPSHVLHVVAKALEAAHVRQQLSEAQAGGRTITPRFESRNPAYRSMIEVVERVAMADAPVLFEGETGTGKGVLARHLHALSPHRARPFVTVNCAALSSALAETELFGHARGAFTGANSSRAGFVETAGSGTLFLDEVSDLSKEVQGTLLRLLEAKEYLRVGESEPRHSNARVLASTRRELKTAVAQGLFRDDLYYRLNVVTVRVPPLRERVEDVPELTDVLLQNLAQQHRRAPFTVSAAARGMLSAYPWPGNLRELVNVLERAVLLAQGQELTPDLLPEELRAKGGRITDENDDTLEAAERRHIASVLARYPTLDAAAKALGVDASTLYRKRERYGLR